MGFNSAFKGLTMQLLRDVLSILKPVYVFTTFSLLSILILSFCLQLLPDVVFSKAFLGKTL